MMKGVLLMKKILCILLIFVLILPALAAAAPSKTLQAAYDAADALSVDELLDLQDYISAKINAPAASDADEITYVLNKNTKKFHYADCSSAKSIKDANRATYIGSRNDLIAKGYQACKRCNP